MTEGQLRRLAPTERVARTTGDSQPSREPLSPEVETLGRYLLEERLGAGGMGEVFRARDPELDRPVAIKRLLAYDDDDAAHLRMLREGQAIARLNHPNIVQVYDVGRDPRLGDLFIAMELVEGMTLRHWLRARDRGWREIAAVFVQAGEALLAAHDQGLVHRDFKPENVLVTPAGVAKVVDFGLAKPASVPPAAGGGAPVPTLASQQDDDAMRPESSSHRSPASPHRGVFGSDITPVGARLGTPAYMPPEQGGDASASPLSDQFSFAVALFEALCGFLPFPGDGPAEYFIAVLEGAMLDFPRPSPVPLRLQRAIRRALSPAPAARFPSLAPLLDELRRDSAAQRRRWAMLGATLGAGAMATVAAQLVWPDDGLHARCLRESAAATSAWNDEVRGHVARSLRAVALPFADDTATRALDGLDELTAAWQAARLHWCTATPVGQAPAPVHAAMGACFEQMLSRQRELVASLADADRDALLHGLEAIERLRFDLSRCEQPAYLAHFRDAETPGRLADLELLARARQRLDLGQTTAGLRALGELQDTGDADVVLEAGLLRAALEKARGNLGTARDLLERAAREGLGSGDALLAAEWNANYGDVLYALDQLDGLRAPYERAWSLRRTHLGDEHGETLVAAAARGHEAYARGDYELALELYREAAQRAERALPDRDYNRILIDEWLAQALSHTGALEQARTLTADLVERLRHSRGPTHPRTLEVLDTLATIELRAGESEQALEHFRESLIGRVPVAQGGDPVALATTMANIGACETKLGRLDAAAESLQTALQELVQAGLGDDHVHVSAVVANLAQVDKRRGRLDLALAGYTRARAQLRAAGQDATTDGLMVRLNYAEVLMGLGRIAEGESELRAALEQVDGADAALRMRMQLALDVARARALQRDATLAIAR
ncbi:MAG: protein kinase [Nannocystaceae bacterium]|nr:protein kinase [Nannocystaceae bacterium]